MALKMALVTDVGEGCSETENMTLESRARRVVCSCLELAQALPLKTPLSHKINRPGSEPRQDVGDGELFIFWIGLH